MVKSDKITVEAHVQDVLELALAGCRTLAEVRDAAGHANVSIKSAYLHVAVDDSAVGDLFSLPQDRTRSNLASTRRGPELKHHGVSRTQSVAGRCG